MIILNILMTFITFIYKIGNNNKTYYGKYITDYISDDHNGLDTEVMSYLVDGINKYRQKKALSKLHSKINIGILSFSSNKYIPVYSSDNEINCFDFYCIEENNKKTIYINGKQV